MEIVVSEYQAFNMGCYINGNIRISGVDSNDHQKLQQAVEATACFQCEYGKLDIIRRKYKSAWTTDVAIAARMLGKLNQVVYQVLQLQKAGISITAENGPLLDADALQALKAEQSRMHEAIIACCVDENMYLPANEPLNLSEYLLALLETDEQEKALECALKCNISAIYRPGEMLVAAVQHHNHAVFRTLLKRGVAITSRDYNGNTALDYMLQHPKLIKQAYTLFTKGPLEVKTTSQEQLDALWRDETLTSDPRICQFLERLGAKKNEPVLNLIFCCDIDAEDHNGAIQSTAIQALQSRVPLLTTKELLLGCENDSDRKTKQEQIREIIQKDYRRWTFYVQGELVLAIPKDYPYAYAQLTALPCNEEFRRVDHWGEILTGPSAKATIDEVTQLFERFALAKVKVILDGHGGNDRCIGGLNAQSYAKFLACLMRVKCEFLEIISCHAGGSNTLKHVLTDKAKKLKQTPRFPIVVNSIGAFTTTSSIKLEGYFQAVHQTLSKLGGCTHKAFRTMRHQFEGKPALKKFKNLAQIKFPHSGANTGHFSALLEDNSSFGITYTSLQAHKLQFHPKKDQERVPKLTTHPSLPILVEGKSVLETTPLVIDRSVTIKRACPILLSLLPGKAHHFFDEVTLEGHNIIQFFRTSAIEYNDTEARKAIFFDKIVDQTGELTQVVFDLDLKTQRCYFKRGNPAQYFRFRHINDVLHCDTISASEFISEVYLIALETRPAKKALQLSSGGQESDEDFFNALESSLAKNCTLPQDLILFRKFLCGKQTSQELKQFYRQLDPAWHQTIFECALLLYKPKLARLLLILGRVEPRQRDYCGSLFLNYAINTKDLPLVKLMIQRGADPNLASEISKNTPLICAAKNGDTAMVEFLLKQLERKNADPKKKFLLKLMGEAADSNDKRDIDARDALGWTALQSCAGVPECFQLILATGYADINRLTHKGWTALSYAAHCNNYKQVEMLLAAGASPDLGQPSPLGRAIRGKNLKMVEFLLSKGCNPMHPDSENKTPLQIAAERGTPSILNALIRHCNLTDKAVVSDLFKSAVAYRHFANATVLMQNFDCDANERDDDRNTIIYHAFMGGHVDLIKAYLQWNHEPILSSEKILDIYISILINKDLELLRLFTKVFKTTLNRPLKDGYTCLFMALEDGNRAVVKVLLENGANGSSYLKQWIAA